MNRECVNEFLSLNSVLPWSLWLAEAQRHRQINWTGKGQLKRGVNNVGMKWRDVECGSRMKNEHGRRARRRSRKQRRGSRSAWSREHVGVGFGPPAASRGAAHTQGSSAEEGSTLQFTCNADKSGQGYLMRQWGSQRKLTRKRTKLRGKGWNTDYTLKKWRKEETENGRNLEKTVKGELRNKGKENVRGNWGNKKR